MKNTGHIFAVVTMGVLIVGGVVFLGGGAENTVPEEVAFSAGDVAVRQSVSDGVYAVMYKSPTCGCCMGHAEAMREAGIIVETVDMEQVDLLSLKQEYGVVSPDMMSCHTTILSYSGGEYVVEGHVPIEGIRKLLDEQPDIPGIFLPGMPIGTPGMPGFKIGPYNIMTLEEEPKLFVSL